MNTEKAKSKKCTKCGETKLKTEFYVGGKCKECLKAAQRERNKKAKELHDKIKKDPKLKETPKVCCRCKKTKTVCDFRINRGECIDCEREFGREYNQEHQDVRKKWQDENKEHFDKLRADRYQRKKPEICEKYRERYATDHCFRVKQLLKRRLQISIAKIGSTEDYIGTTFERVADWLEYNFTDGMTWENHGTVWDIDHVIPVYRWDLTDPKQVEMCFNWKNLSPLECGKNRNGKRSYIDYEQVVRHLRNEQKYFIEKKLNEDELFFYILDYGRTIIKNGKYIR